MAVNSPSKSKANPNSTAARMRSKPKYATICTEFDGASLYVAKAVHLARGVRALNRGLVIDLTAQPIACNSPHEKPADGYGQARSAPTARVSAAVLQRFSRTDAKRPVGAPPHFSAAMWLALIGSHHLAGKSSLSACAARRPRVHGDCRGRGVKPQCVDKSRLLVEHVAFVPRDLRRFP